MGNPFGVAPQQQQAPMGMGANMGAPNPFAPQMMTTQQPAMTSPFGQMNNQMANMNLTSNPFAQPTLAQAQPPMVRIGFILQSIILHIFRDQIHLLIWVVNRQQHKQCTVVAIAISNQLIY